MSVKQVEYHAGATADVKSALTWYQRRSPKVALDFIEELNRATETIRKAPERWPAAKEQHKTLSTLAISLHDYLFSRRICRHCLGCRPWQQASRVLEDSFVIKAR